jgi:hypothetical protein
MMSHTLTIREVNFPLGISFSFSSHFNTKGFWWLVGKDKMLIRGCWRFFFSFSYWLLLETVVGVVFGVR